MFRSKDRDKCRQLYEKYYTGHKFYDTIYRELIQKYLPREGRLLDAGCGRYLRFSKEFAKTADVVGIDLESALETANQCSPFGVRGDLNRLLYRANTLRKIGKEPRSAGLAKRELHAVTHYPAYLTISPVLFRLGVAYERLTSLEIFRSLRSVILCVFEKETGQNSAIDQEESVDRTSFTSVRA